MQDQHGVLDRGLADLHRLEPALERGVLLDGAVDLLRRATALEAKYLAKIVVGEMRHGVQEGIVLDAIAALGGAAGARCAAPSRRSATSAGSPRWYAAIRRRWPRGRQLFHPIKPMLAQSAADVGAGVAALDGRLALEWKLDGARVQIHKQGDKVRIFSRRLQEITASLPDVAAAVTRDAAAETAVFEGEVIAIAGERPLPFQELMRRFRRIRDIEAVAREVPVQLYLFDLLHVGERSLIDHPPRALGGAATRRRRPRPRPRLVPADAARARRSTAPRSPPATKASWRKDSTAPTRPACAAPRG